MSLRLETKPFEWKGRTYPLRCNMAVLETLQDGPGKGEIGNLFKIPTITVVFEILKAMIDDAREDDPSLPEVSMRELKKAFSPAEIAELGVLRMFTAAVTPGYSEAEAAAKTQAQQVSDPDTAAGEHTEPENSGN